MLVNALKFLSFIGAILVFIWMAGLLWFGISLQGKYVPDLSANKEAIIVLTGGPKRVNAGLDMLADRKAGLLFISGVNKQTSVRDLLDLWGEEPPEQFCCIILGHAARNTAENAKEVREWMIKNDLRRAYLVTARTHIPRAKLEIEHSIPDADITYYPLDDRNTRLKTCLLTLFEYNKTLLTWIKLKFI